MLLIAIDPGISGSLCFFEDRKIIDLIDDNIYGLHLLMSEYNKKLINYINEVANLEAIDIEYIHKEHYLDQILYLLSNFLLCLLLHF